MWKELPSKLWDLANAITAFSVAQVIAYLYLLTKGDLVEGIKSDYLLECIIFTLILIFHGIYLYAICWCHKIILKLESGSMRGRFGLVSTKVKRGQISIIVLFAIGAVCMTMYVIRL